MELFHESTESQTARSLLPLPYCPGDLFIGERLGSGLLLRSLLDCSLLQQHRPPSVTVAPNSLSPTGRVRNRLGYICNLG